MKRRSLNVRLYLMYVLAIAPLIIFGAYKNGFYLYRKGLIDAFTALRPLIILACSIAAAIAGSLVRERRRKTPVGPLLINNIKGDIVEAILVTAILPISSNILVVTAVNFIFSLFLHKLRFNRVALMYIFIEGVNILLGLNEFRNIYELKTVLNYDGVDLFFGSGPGGIFSTNVFLMVLGLIFLSFNKLYKKETVIPALATFLVLGVGTKLIMGDYGTIYQYIFGYNILFVIIFIAPNLYSSSYTVKGQITSGVLLGILSVVLSFWTPYTAAILAVIIVSLCKGILDRIFVIK